MRPASPITPAGAVHADRQRSLMGPDPRAPRPDRARPASAGIAWYGHALLQRRRLVRLQPPLEVAHSSQIETDVDRESEAVTTSVMLSIDLPVQVRPPACPATNRVDIGQAAPTSWPRHLGGDRQLAKRFSCPRRHWRCPNEWR